MYSVTSHLVIASKACTPLYFAMKQYHIYRTDLRKEKFPSLHCMASQSHSNEASLHCYMHHYTYDTPGYQDIPRSTHLGVPYNVHLEPDQMPYRQTLESIDNPTHAKPPDRAIYPVFFVYESDKGPIQATQYSDDSPLERALSFGRSAASF